jgi:hypothetical protein
MKRHNPAFVDAAIEQPLKPTPTMNIPAFTRGHRLLRLGFFAILFILASPGDHVGVT